MMQALLEEPELDVGQAAGRLLAVPGEERDRRALAQQADRGFDLVRPTPSSPAIRRTIVSIRV